MKLLFFQALKASVSFALLKNTAGFTGFLNKPVAYLPKFNSVLLSEPYENRIGIYNAKTFAFNSWLQHPNITNGTKFQFPHGFLLLENGNFVIIEETQINILNKNLAPCQPPIAGKFMGLSEGPKGEIITLQLPGVGEWKFGLKKLTEKNRKYVWCKDE